MCKMLCVMERQSVLLDFIWNKLTTHFFFLKGTTPHRKFTSVNSGELKQLCIVVCQVCALWYTEIMCVLPLCASHSKLMALQCRESRALGVAVMYVDMHILLCIVATKVWMDHVNITSCHVKKNKRVVKITHTPSIRCQIGQKLCMERCCQRPLLWYKRVFRKSIPLPT